MRIPASLSPTRANPLPAGSVQEAPAEAAHLPGSSKNIAAEAAGNAPAALERNLEAQLHKARIASLLVPPVLAAPRQASALRAPDAALQKPKPEVASRLHDMLNAARTAAKSGDEQGRLEVDKVLQEIVKAYGIGQGGVTGLEFDPKFTEQGGTIGAPGKPRTFIVIGPSALNSPEELASTILHESSHVQRNKELADAGLDRDSMGMKAQAVYEALIEIEGYQLEIRNAKKLGTSASYVKGAEQLRDRYLRELEVAAGPEWRAMAEKGQFAQLHEKFRKEQLRK